MLLIIEPQALIRKSNSINVKNKKRAGKHESKTNDEETLAEPPFQICTKLR